jgi:hypothetical protein
MQGDHSSAKEWAAECMYSVAFYTFGSQNMVPIESVIVQINHETNRYVD